MSWPPRNENTECIVETHNRKNNGMCLNNKYEQNSTSSSTAAQQTNTQPQEQTMLVNMDIDPTQDDLHRYALENPDYWNLILMDDEPQPRETQSSHLNQPGKELTTTDPSMSETTHDTHNTDVDEEPSNNRRADSATVEESQDQKCPRGNYYLRSRDTATVTNSVPVQETQASARIIPSKQNGKTKKKQRRRSKPRKQEEVRVYVDRICDEDILCGRGGKSNHHPGNIRYRETIQGYRAMYRSFTEKDEKTGLSHELVARVKREGCRFVKLDQISHRWYIASDKIARRKTAQALREKDPPEDRLIRDARRTDDE
mmetsp:Transcript_5683/g.8065  ORF Transcript_5683/g.8065 Transcript_5683/m.8065 type:complete len:314 (-) Transcript_5683:171-1112(-)